MLPQKWAMLPVPSRVGPIGFRPISESFASQEAQTTCPIAPDNVIYGARDSQMDWTLLSLAMRVALTATAKPISRPNGKLG